MTAQDIIDQASQARAALAALEENLASRVDAIEAAAFDANRPFTAQERAERDQLRASLAEVRDAFRELGFVTLQQLDASDTVKDLNKNIQDVNLQIDDDLNRLKNIAAFAETAAQVAKTLAAVAASLVNLAAAFP